MSSVAGMMAVTGTVSGGALEGYALLEAWGQANGWSFATPYCSGNVWGIPWQAHTTDSNVSKLAYMMVPNAAMASAMVTAGHKVGMKTWNSGNANYYNGTSRNGCSSQNYNANYSYYQRDYVYYNASNGLYYRNTQNTDNWYSFTPS